ncbi:type IV pilin protein [Variovorax sp. VNK109]|uniref:type IV pilin protein n=1 Tax=Variovorax sp. VNK109 TaxID=3400919 RepID=UPI003C0BA77B
MQRKNGFTLIEMMIVVSIVSILAAIAIPAYSDYIRRSKISEAVAELSSMKLKMEQYFQDKRTYTDSCTANTVAPLPAATKEFTFACPTRTDTTYVVTATGNPGTIMAGFTYTINQAGVKQTLALPTGWPGAGNTTTCWITKKGDLC